MIFSQNQHIQITPLYLLFDKTQNQYKKLAKEIDDPYLKRYDSTIISPKPVSTSENFALHLLTGISPHFFLTSTTVTMKLLPHSSIPYHDSQTRCFNSQKLQEVFCEIAPNMQAKVVDWICILIEQRRRTSLLQLSKTLWAVFRKINKYDRLLLFIFFNQGQIGIYISVYIRSQTWEEACKTKDRIGASISLLFIKVSILFSLLGFRLVSLFCVLVMSLDDVCL